MSFVCFIQMKFCTIIHFANLLSSSPTQHNLSLSPCLSLSLSLSLSISLSLFHFCFFKLILSLHPSLSLSLSPLLFSVSLSLLSFQIISFYPSFLSFWSIFFLPFFFSDLFSILILSKILTCLVTPSCCPMQQKFKCFGLLSTSIFHVNLKYNILCVTFHLKG